VQKSKVTPQAQLILRYYETAKRKKNTTLTRIASCEVAGGTNIYYYAEAANSGQNHTVKHNTATMAATLTKSC